MKDLQYLTVLAVNGSKVLAWRNRPVTDVSHLYIAASLCLCFICCPSLTDITDMAISDHLHWYCCSVWHKCFCHIFCETWLILIKFAVCCPEWMCHKTVSMCG